MVNKLAVAKASFENPFLNNMTYAPSLLGPTPKPEKNIKNKNFLSKGFSLKKQF